MRLSSELSEVVCFIVMGMLFGSILCFICMMDVNKASVYDSRFESFEYHGHKYLKYSDPVQAFSTTLHDPDCSCKTNKIEVVQ